MQLLHGCSREEPVKFLPRQMRQVPVPEGWSDIFSGHFEPFLRLSNRKISQRRPFRHGSFHLIFPRLGHGLGQDRKPAAQVLRRCKQRIATDFCRFPGQSAHTSARCPSESVFASDSRRRSGRSARHSRCATQNCRSATSGKSRGCLPVHILCKAQVNLSLIHISEPTRH